MSGSSWRAAAVALAAGAVLFPACGGGEQQALQGQVQPSTPVATAAPASEPAPASAPEPATGPAEAAEPEPPAGETVLLFASDRDGDLEIFRMGVDGSGQAQVTLDTWDEYQPDASAATGWVAFSVAFGGIEIVAPGSDTYVLDNVWREGTGFYWPAWSPDGSRIAFVSKRDGNAEIYVMNADGSGQVRLTDDPAADVEPAWAVEPAGGFGVYATDSFDDPASGWESYGGETSSAGYEQGSLVVRASEPRWLAISAAPPAVPSRSSIRLDARDTGGATDTGFGFVCGYEDIDNHFAAGIGSDGTYAILERRNGATTILTGDGSWAPSDAIEAGAESYRIEGTCGETRIELWVDGREVETAWDVDLPENGALGVFVETFGDGGAEIRFDEIAYSGFPRTVLPSLTRAP